MPSSSLSTDVLIVGGGPVGLALANELGMRGIPALLVEQTERNGWAPRAKTTNVRSMEHMRRWGIAERVRDAAPMPRDYPTDVFFLTRLFGRELAHFDNAFNGSKRRDERYNEPAQWIPQYKIEAVLRERLADRASIRLRYGARLEGIDQDASGVTATIVDVESGAIDRISAKFLVGADGARSRVRGLIGARMMGDHGLGHHYNMILRIPELGRSPPRQRGIMYWLVNTEAPATMSPMDVGDLWTFGTALPPEAPELGPEEVRRRVFAALGRDLDFDIVATDRWSGHRLMADRYREGRVFLAGDACHLHPPYGGFGMNMGIGDAVDLGWKLAAVLQDWGGPHLLASYETERRSVHERVLEESVRNYSVLSRDLVRDGLEGDDEYGRAARAALGAEILRSKRQEFQSLGVVLGAHYSGSPIVVPDGTAPPTPSVTDYEMSAHPGCLAPHAWLSETVSLYDRFGPGFTLLVLDPALTEASEGMLQAAETCGVPLEVLHVPNPDLRARYAAGLVLVRPDQHVAFRSDSAPAAPGDVLDRVRGAVGAASA